MLEKIKQAFQHFTFLSPVDLIKIASITKIVKINKGVHFIKDGEISFQTALVLKGLLRHYIINKDGTEKTLLFIPEKKSTGSPDTIFSNKPSSENIIALEDSIILKIDSRDFERIAKNNIRLLTLQNKSLKEVILSDVEQIKSLTIFSPEERYNYFCKTYPHLEQRIKQKYLASYLGITPTSLSRLRARIIPST